MRWMNFSHFFLRMVPHSFFWVTPTFLESPLTSIPQGREHFWSDLVQILLHLQPHCYPYSCCLLPPHLITSPSHHLAVYPSSSSQSITSRLNLRTFSLTSLSSAVLSSPPSVLSPVHWGGLHDSTLLSLLLPQLSLPTHHQTYQTLSSCSLVVQNLHELIGASGFSITPNTLMISLPTTFTHFTSTASTAGTTFFLAEIKSSASNPRIPFFYILSPPRTFP